MTKPYYAYEAFPWINIDKSWTTCGFFDHRHTTQRKAWGEVLSGSDEQIISAAVLLEFVSVANNAMTEEEVSGFYKYILSNYGVEELFKTRFPKDDFLRAFCGGIMWDK